MARGALRLLLGFQLGLMVVFTLVRCRVSAQVIVFLAGRMVVLRLGIRRLFMRMSLVVRGGVRRLCLCLRMLIRRVLRVLGVFRVVVLSVRLWVLIIILADRLIML